MLAIQNFNSNNTFTGRLPKKSKLKFEKFENPFPKPVQKDYETCLREMFMDPTQRTVFKFEHQAIPKNELHPEFANETVVIRRQNSLQSHINTYNEKGQLIRQKEQATSTHFEYDELNRCTRKHVEDFYGNKLSDITYEYKGNGEVIESVKAIPRKDYVKEQRLHKLSINA